MKTSDHLALGRHMAAGSPKLQKHRIPFLLGCIEPDRNPFTYLRSVSGHVGIQGHNAENSCAYVKKCLNLFQTGGIGSSLDWFRLGTVIHYVADSFTYPHNAFFHGGMREHIRYEQELHSVFSWRLFSDAGRCSPWEPFSASERLLQTRSEYSAAPHNVETDCLYIINVCTELLKTEILYSLPDEPCRFAPEIVA